MKKKRVVKQLNKYGFENVYTIIGKLEKEKERHK